METIAFKPYACGTMTQPFIDCAIALAEHGVAPDDIAEIVCEVGGGNRAPPVGAAGRRSTGRRRRTRRSSARRSAWRSGFVDRKAGFAQFTEDRIHDPAVLALAAKIRYVVDPARRVPAQLHAATCAPRSRDGSEREFRQPHMRGGAHAPLPDRRTGERSSWTTRATAAGAARWPSRLLRAVARDLFALPRLDALAEFRA